MKLQLCLLMAIMAIAVSGCERSQSVKMNPTGAAGDLLVVMDDSLKKSPEGKAILEMMTQPMLGLPQDEPIFSASVMPHRAFLGQTKALRNILMVTIGSHKHNDTIIYIKNHWATGQAVAQIFARNKSVAKQLAVDNEIKLVSFFTKAERERIMAYNRQYPNAALMAQIEKQWGIKLTLPNTYAQNKSTSTFTWMSIEGPLSSTGLIIYDFPYAGDESLSKSYLLNKRDSVLHKHLLGAAPGSYMTTEHQYPIQYKQFTVAGEPSVELRGLWKVQGDLMGGPFVSHAHYNKSSNRVVITEGYVYAPEKPNKRNYIRQLEAVLLSYQTKK